MVFRTPRRAGDNVKNVLAIAFLEIWRIAKNNIKTISERAAKHPVRIKEVGARLRIEWVPVGDVLGFFGSHETFRKNFSQFFAQIADFPLNDKFLVTTLNGEMTVIKRFNLSFNFGNRVGTSSE